MKKTILVELPVHVKKFFMVEYSGYTAKNGSDQIDVKKFSELGGEYGVAGQSVPWQTDHQLYLLGISITICEQGRYYGQYNPKDNGQPKANYRDQ